MEPNLQRVTEEIGRKNTHFGLEKYGLTDLARVYWNLSLDELPFQIDEIMREVRQRLNNVGR